MNNLNCHPEDIEESQPIHISTRDIAEDARFNYEISEELRKYQTNHQLSFQCLILGRSKKQPTLFFARRRNETCCCETAEAVETTAKSELSRWLRNPYLTWILGSSPSMTRIFCLTIFTLLPTLAHAETCTPTPDCASLGYTETSCPDGSGVKCPWNTSLLYCGENGKKICADMGYPYTCSGANEYPSGKACANKYYTTCTCATDYAWKEGKCEKFTNGFIGDLYYCNGTVVGIKVPGQNFAIAMNNSSSKINWYSANSYCSSYLFCGTGTEGRLPTKDELLKIHDNITYLQEQLQKNGGQQLFNEFYSSSDFYSETEHVVVNMVSGDISRNMVVNYNYVRPVLAF